MALWRQTAGGARCLTPREFDLRSRANEYGGRCFCIFGDEIIFNNAADGRLYRQSLTADTPPRAMTVAACGRANFADCIAVATPQNPAVFAVLETAEADGSTRNCLAQIPLTARGLAAPATVAEGADFYANPVWSAARNKIAWLEWDHPHMPWDQTRLCIAELNRDGLLCNRRTLVDAAQQSVCQIGFLRAGDLLFVSDSPTNDFWNFFICRDGHIRQLTQANARDNYEFGEPHWQFGQRRWRQITDDKIIAVGSAHHGDQLFEIALHSGAMTPRDRPIAACAQLNFRDGELLYIAKYADRPAAIRAYATTGHRGRDVYPPPARARFKPPRPISYPTENNARAYAYFYAPQNEQYAAPSNSKPPLLVMVHGGPTGRASAELHPVKQFFAARGYAILDVNHRGSTGYGRAYRQSLLGNWGETDSADIARGIEYIVNNDEAARDMVFIRGGSAGGYAVLRMLTQFPQMFRGGACYYGIGNLITLANCTHEFERHYTDRLIGEKFTPAAAANPRSLFVRRSPIFHLDALACPLILFQGLRDQVVPPQVAREIVAALAAKKIPYEYMEYENEGHGFRSAAARVDALTREAEFFARLLAAPRE